VPDHSWLSRTRTRLPLEVHDQVFTWVLERLAAHGLTKGERIGVDASTMEANAALRTIVRRDSGEGYREMLTRMARESGVETPTAEDLVRLDRNGKGKKLSNADLQSLTDPDARIAKLKDRRTHLAYKPEHAMDLDFYHSSWASSTRPRRPYSSTTLHQDSAHGGWAIYKTAKGA
jgi:transposase